MVKRKEDLALNKKIGAEIKRIRTQIFKASQEKACEIVFGKDRAEKMQSQWSKWERGLVRPSVQTLSAIARKADLPLAVFGEIVAPNTRNLDPVSIEALRYHLTAALAILVGIAPPRPISELNEWITELIGAENNRKKESDDA